MKSLPALLIAFVLPFASTSAIPQATSGVLIRDIKFVGVTQLPQADADRCLSDLGSRTFSGPNWLEDVAERARITCWQAQGYFKAKVTPTAQPVPPRHFAVTLNVDEGRQYRLKNITFTGNRVLSSEALRSSIPLADGEVFNSDRIRQGIENLRRAYGRLGYINMTSIPDTEIDDANRLIQLHWDIEEGQFTVRGVEFDGVTPATADTLHKVCKLNPGDVYNWQSLDSCVSQFSTLVPAAKFTDVAIQPDNVNGTVNLQFKFAKREK